MGDEESRIGILRKQKDACVKECASISKEIADIEEFEQKKSIANISLTPDKKLIDFLIQRILDPAPDWKAKINTLIHISNSMKGEGFIRGGSYFEALFQLAIAIGEMPQFRNVKQFYDIKGYKKKVELHNYLYTKQILNAGGGETGIADIMFEIDTGNKGDVPEDYRCGEVFQPKNVNGNPFYFISVKGFNQEKSVAHAYDIPLLDQQLDVFPELKNRHIVVCVRNKEQFMTRLGRTKQDFLKNSIDHVIGYDEVMDVFDAFRTRFFVSLGDVSPSLEAIEKRTRELFPERGAIKPGLSLYFHQELVVKSVVARIQEVGEPKEPHFMCIGVLPRGGKSFIAGGIIDAHRKQKPVYNVLFLTSAVSETIEQFNDDLIGKFSEFSDFTFVDPRTNPQDYVEGKSSFVFISRQLSSKKVKVGATEMDEGEETDTSLLGSDIVQLLTERLKTFPSFDICFFDEAHIGINSSGVRENFMKAFSAFKMPIILMSATYSRPANALSDNKDLFVWDLQDIKDMKGLPTVGFDGFAETNPDVLNRYPAIAKQILDFRRRLGQTETQIAKPYVNFPNPNFISLTFTPETVTKFEESATGYDFNATFRIKPKSSPELIDHAKYKQWGELLTNRDQALRVRQFLTPDEEEGDDYLKGTERKYRAFNQIFRIAHQTGSRPVQGQPFSVLMFLPRGAGLIGEVCRVWASFLYESTYWRSNFVFLTLSVNTNKKYKALPNMTPELAVERGICHREDFKTPLKETIQNVEREALKHGKGLVILSGDVAKMGISLKCVDVVCLLTDTTDADDIIQKMYRALTDDPPSKKNGFIVDLNVKRIITAMFGYAMEKVRRNPGVANVSTRERFASLFQLCNWGQDAFIEDEASKGKTLAAIMQDINVRVLDTLTSRVHSENVARIAKKQVELIWADQALEQEMKRVLKGTKGKKSAKKEVIAERNPDLPDDGPSNAAAAPAVAAEPPPPSTLTDEQIKAKMGDIVLTFINALVIKSSEKLGSNFGDLMDKLETDEKTATRTCDCSVKSSCKTPHANLYDTAFCEVKPYAMSSDGQYDEVAHVGIMRLLMTIFKKSSHLAPDWQTYIDGLVSELASKQAGGRRRRTWKKRARKVRHVRDTRRNHGS
jgi:hypothetical protein